MSTRRHPGIVSARLVHWVRCNDCEQDLEVDDEGTAESCRREARAAGWVPNEYGGWTCPRCIEREAARLARTKRQ